MGKWIFVVLVAAIAFFSWNSGRSARSLEATAEDIKKRAPFDVGPGVRLEKAELKGKEFLMNVTFTDEDPAAPRAQQQKAIYLLKETLTTDWCGQKVIRRAINDGFVMSAVVNRADGSELTRISVKSWDCVCAAQGGHVCVNPHLGR